MHILYRLATKNDWTELAGFRNRYSEKALPLDQKHFQQDFETNENEGPLFVAHAFEKIVGYGRCGYFDSSLGKSIYGLGSEVPSGFYLKGVLTDLAVRGLGVGKQLTILRNDWVKERSSRIFCILQNTNVPSLRMHEALGYQIIKGGLCYQGVQGDASGVLLELVFAENIY